LRRSDVVGEAAHTHTLHQLIDAPIETQHALISLAALLSVEILNQLFYAARQLCALLKTPSAVEQHRADLALARRPVCHFDFNRNRAGAHVVPDLGFVCAVAAPAKRSAHRHSVVSAATCQRVHALFGSSVHWWIK
jgi:hypothetical protein